MWPPRPPPPPGAPSAPPCPPPLNEVLMSSLIVQDQPGHSNMRVKNSSSLFSSVARFWADSLSCKYTSLHFRQSSHWTIRSEFLSMLNAKNKGTFSNFSCLFLGWPRGVLCIDVCEGERFQRGSKLFTVGHLRVFKLNILSFEMLSLCGLQYHAHIQQQFVRYAARLLVGPCA